MNTPSLPAMALVATEPHATAPANASVGTALPRVARSHRAIRALPRRRLRAAETAELVRTLRADPAYWRDAVRHDPSDRWHARLHWSPFVEVYLLGWTPEQDTRLHDHGGSVGAFAVADGELFEECGRARSATIEQRRHQTGQVVAFGARHVHNLGNLGPAVATSIHAYSPPLPFMRFYEPDATGRLRAAYQLPVDGPEADDAAPRLPLASTGSVRRLVGTGSARPAVGTGSPRRPVAGETPT